MTMVKVLAPYLVTAALLPAYFSVHGFGGQPCPPAAHVIYGILFGTFAVAFFVHKEQTGKPLL